MKEDLRSRSRTYLIGSLIIFDFLHFDNYLLSQNLEKWVPAKNAEKNSNKTNYSSFLAFWAVIYCRFPNLASNTQSLDLKE